MNTIHPIKMFFKSLVFLLCIASLCFAKISAKFTSSSKVLGQGDPFIVTLQVSSDKELHNIPNPIVIKKPQHVSLSIEKNKSYSNNMSWTNGKLTQYKSNVYNFVLRFNTSKVGLYQLGPILFKYQTLEKKFPPTKVNVLLKKQSLNIKETYSKKTVFVGEQVRYNLRLFLENNILNANIPDFKTSMNNHLLVINLDSTIKRQKISENGIPSSIADISLTLFPLVDGLINIPPLKIQYQEANRNRRSFFDQTQIKKTILTAHAIIQVHKLPTPEPPDFLGGVGQYSISSKINQSSLIQDNVLTYTAIVTGNGNPQSIKPPQIKLSNFEVFDPEVSSKQKIKGNTFITISTYTYILIPNKIGKQKIPALEYTFFNSTTKKYETVKSSSHIIQVSKNTNRTSSFHKQTQIPTNQKISEDIQYIKINDNEIILRKKQSSVLLQPLFCILFFFPPFLFIILLSVQYLKNNRLKNLQAYKKNKALESAKKHLTKIEREIDSFSKVDYQKQLLVVLEQFVSDRLQINLKGLTQQDFKSYLKKLGCKDSTLKNIADFLTKIEFHLFGQQKQNTTNLIQDTKQITVIIQNLNLL